MKRTNLMSAPDKLKLARKRFRLPQVYEVPKSSVALRDRLLRDSQSITVINSPEMRALATRNARNIRTHIKQVEEARKDLTAPLLEAQRRVKALADDHCALLPAELKRVDAMDRAWREADHKRVEEEERARAAEVARLESERKDAEARLQAAVRAGDVSEVLEAQQAAMEADQASRAAITAPLPAPSKVAGAPVKMHLRHIVTDINVLYKWRPDLCNPPTLKASAVQALCVARKGATLTDPDTDILGLSLYWEEQVEYRSW